MRGIGTGRWEAMGQPAKQEWLKKRRSQLTGATNGLSATSYSCCMPHDVGILLLQFVHAVVPFPFNLPMLLFSIACIIMTKLKHLVQV
jgi:hypothetical protein